MAIDAYDPCPCGSGKKFKWCCQPIHGEIDKAFRQASEGQVEAALRTMDQVVAEHPTNPEAWGRQAQLQFLTGKPEEAETTLQKAFAINANYPFGHLLQGIFRQNEGEVVGALLLFRKAADLYDPEARDTLSGVYQMIADCERMLNRPVAAHAAIRISLRLNPLNEELQKAAETDFGPQSRLPEAARKDYTFLPCPADASPQRKDAWKHALTGADTGKLSDSARAFEQLTAEDGDNPAAWYNLGLARTWLGDNKAAMEAFNRYLELEADESRAASAWALVEVLRMGRGLEDQSDYQTFSATFQIRDPQPVVALLQEWESSQRLVGIQSRQEENFLSGLVLEAPPVLTAGPARNQPARLASYLLIVENLLRVWGSVKESVDRVRADLVQKVGPGVTEARQEVGAAHFTDVVMEAIMFPLGATNQDQANQVLADHAGRFFEEVWIHRPLRSLNGIPPIDAAGHRTLRKKLLGVIQFLADCAAIGLLHVYNFDQLRRKLGLLDAAPAAPTSTGPNIGAMSTAELAGLQAEQMADEQLEEAFQTALKLDARELAGRFAQGLVSRPGRAERPDRYPQYSHLIQGAVQEGNLDSAMDLINAGEKADCEQNEGRRRNEYELRRGQLHAKRGEIDAARDVFQRLIDRSPSELRYRGSAVESFLSARNGASALQFAEPGLAKAREQNNRDSEQYFMELVEAARKMKG